MECPRCGTKTDSWPCPNCGFPVFKIKTKNKQRITIKIKYNKRGEK